MLQDQGQGCVTPGATVSACGDSECAGWHHWGEAGVLLPWGAGTELAQSRHRLASAGSAPSAPCLIYGRKALEEKQEGQYWPLRLTACSPGYGHLSHSLAVQHQVASVA